MVDTDQLMSVAFAAWECLTNAPKKQGDATHDGWPGRTAAGNVAMARRQPEYMNIRSAGEYGRQLLLRALLEERQEMDDQ